MKNIRNYAEQVGHQVVGKLTRRPEWEYKMDSFGGEKKHSGCRHYSDEGGNEYIVGKTGIVIVDAEGGVI
ncbi:MAG: hypothetical protein IKJ99_03690 [Oscillospiraceae bacterium]|nr:hypothetical protein [Oscillospiraceae bacterium]